MPNPQIAVQITGQNNLGPTLVVLQKQITGLQHTIGKSAGGVSKLNTGVTGVQADPLLQLALGCLVRLLPQYLSVRR
jgi:hypothetical protein